MDLRISSSLPALILRPNFNEEVQIVLITFLNVNKSYKFHFSSSFWCFLVIVWE